MSILIKKKSRFRGLDLPENKFTEHKPIETIPIPKKAVIPLIQNIGAPCSFIIERGDEVKTGQKIADSKSYVSAPIHSPISGKIKRLSKTLNPATGTLMDSCVIESDVEESRVHSDPVFDIYRSRDYKRLAGIIDSMDRDEILKKIREGGIVGLGGAAFPTHVKLNPPPEKEIDTVILNGCECEPYITSDHRVMLEFGKQVLAGLYIIKRLLDPTDIYIAIEDNKKDAIDHMRELVFDMGFKDMCRIVSLPSRYPMGAEKTLIKTIANRAVPMGGLPMDVGVVVNNVATSRAIYEAVIEDRPLISKVITITGECREKKNVLARIGTPISELVEFCGIDRKKANKVIVGGPMMGNLLLDPDFPVTKGANCILAVDSRIPEEQNCINCGRCVKICPMGLEPLVYVRNVKSGKTEGLEDFYISNCIECGSCAYVCPSNIPIVGHIKAGKAMLAREKNAK